MFLSFHKYTREYPESRIRTLEIMCSKASKTHIHTRHKGLFIIRIRLRILLMCTLSDKMRYISLRAKNVESPHDSISLTSFIFAIRIYFFLLRNTKTMHCSWKCMYVRTKVSSVTQLYVTLYHFVFFFTYTFKEFLFFNFV